MATLFGSVDADSITGTTGSDTLHGGPAGNPGSDVGDDTLLGDSGDDLIFGYVGFDLLLGGEGNDSLQGGNGNDRLLDDADLPTSVPGGNDSLVGEDGDDELTSTGGIDTLDGGAGFDRVVIDRSLATANLDVTLGAGSTVMLGDGTRLIDCEGYTVLFGFGDDRLDAGRSLTARGGEGNDTLIATAATDVVSLSGDGGDDLIDASALPSTARLSTTGGDGNDTILGGAGNDTVHESAGSDRIVAGAGNDEIDLQLAAFRPGTTVDAGVGADLILLTFSAQVVDLTSMGAAGFDGGPNTDRLAMSGLLIFLPGILPFANIEFLNPAAGYVLMGTHGADLYDFGAMAVTDADGRPGARLFADLGSDTVIGTLQAGDFLSGGGGRDSLSGNSGGDVLFGDAGADTLLGFAFDQLIGGAGRDLYIIAENAVNIVEAPDAGRDTVQSAISFALPDQVEVLELSGAAAADGDGNALSNTLLGNEAANRLVGFDGDDLLKGGRGDDSLEGGIGRDTLFGGRGADRLAGGDGRDVLQFLDPRDGDDVLLDFVHREDRIQVSAAGFLGGLAEGMDLAATGRFVIGGAATAGFGQFLFDPATLRLLWDVDGTGSGAAALIATANIALVASDIVVIG